MIKLPLSNVQRQIGDIRCNDFEGRAAIALRQIGIERLTFDPGQNQPRHPRPKTKRRSPDTATQIQHPVTGPRRDRRRQQHRVHSGTIPVSGLQKVQFFRLETHLYCGFRS